MFIEKYVFGQAINPLTAKPVDIYQYVMSNNNNMSVSILTRGATIQSIKYPDKYGNIEDVCLGFGNIQDYIDNKSLYMGAAVGRVASRVAQGKIKIDSKEFVLSKNLNDKHQINGGVNGFDCMIWDVVNQKSKGIVMQHVNPDGLEGYPGQLTATITFTLDDNNKFEMCIEAKSKKKTPVNIAHYLYLNLAGHNTRKEGLSLHNIIIKSKQVIDCDQEQLPTGSFMPVKFTAFDLRKYVILGKRINKFFGHVIKGFDNYYCVDDYDCQIKSIAKVIHPCSGRWVEVLSNQPAVHFYTCNDWPDIEEAGVLPISGKQKAVYAKYGAFCLATQKYPDAMNHEDFPCILLEPKQKYCHKIIYQFGCCCE